MFVKVPVYAAAQLTGAISAAFTLRVLLHPIIKHVGTTTPSGSDVQALIMEIVVTFSMMFITSAVATDTKAVSILSLLQLIKLFSFYQNIFYFQKLFFIESHFYFYGYITFYSLHFNLCDFWISRVKWVFLWLVFFVYLLNILNY